MTSHDRLYDSYVNFKKGTSFLRQERKVLKYLTPYISVRSAPLHPLPCLATAGDSDTGLPDIHSGSDGGDDDGDDYSSPRRDQMGAGGRVRVPARWAASVADTATDAAGEGRDGDAREARARTGGSYGRPDGRGGRPSGFEWRGDNPTSTVADAAPGMTPGGIDRPQSEGRGQMQPPSLEKRCLLRTEILQEIAAIAALAAASGHIDCGFEPSGFD